MTGRILGPYELLENLGEGGMGEVWKARDVRLNRIAAVKILPEAKASSAERRLRLLQEAQSASALNHPNIITIYGIDHDGGTDYIAMEYVQGATLGKLIPRTGLPLKKVLEYGICIASGLAAAHAAGIVHRDLKPGNVMVRDDGQVKVLDFGLAKAAQSWADGDEQRTETLGGLTEAGTIVGTISYMSPEQAEGKPVDARSDIFSFGALLYEMVTGQRAFGGDSKLSTLSAILRDFPRPAGELTEGVPGELERLIERCLRKDRARRFQSMLDLKVVLEDLQQDTQSGTLGAPVGLTVPRRQWRPRLAYIAAAAGAVVLGVAGWYALQRRNAAPEAPPKITQFSFFEGDNDSPAFSPDGRQIAFEWNGEKQDNFDIYVKMISTGSQLRLTTSPARDAMPVWSPDGNYIAFVRSGLPTGSAVYLISPLGGAERWVADYRSIWGIDWSPDGKWLVLAARKEPQGPLNLILQSPESGEQRKLTTNSQWSDGSPVFSPDGRSIAYTHWLSGASTGVFVQDLTDAMTPKGPPRRVENMAGGYAWGLAWTPDGESVVFGRTSPNTGLWRVPADGGSPPQRIPYGNNGVGPAIARRGNLMAYVVRFNDVNIWELQLSAPGVAAGPPTRLIGAVEADQSPVISPDGRRIVFESSRSGKTQLWTANRDASNQQPLVSVGPGTTGSARWSPDGSRFVFDGRPAGQGPAIWTIEAERGSARRLTDTQFDCVLPGWSHDGKFIYYSSNRTGRFELFRMPADGGPAVQVTRNGGKFGQVSPDGKTLYFQKDGHPSLWKVPVEGGEEVEVTGTRARSERMWYPVNDGMYFLDAETDALKQTTYTLKYLAHRSGQIRNVLRLEKPPSYGLSVAPDGRSLLFSQTDRAGSEIMLVENFQ